MECSAILGMGMGFYTWIGSSKSLYSIHVLWVPPRASNYTQLRVQAAHSCGLLEIHCGMRYGVVTCYSGLLGFPGKYQQVRTERFQLRVIGGTMEHGLHTVDMFRDAYHADPLIVPVL